MSTQRPEARLTAPVRVVALLLVPVVVAHAAEPAVEPAGVERLKQDYLACAQSAQTRRLTHPEAAACSQVAEQLLRRAFDGDLDRLLDWWRVSRARVAPAS